MPSPVTWTVTLGEPTRVKTWVTVWPEAVPPSPKFQSQACACASAAVKAIGCPTPACQRPLENVAPLTVKALDGTGGPPWVIVIVDVAVLVVWPSLAVTVTVWVPTLV